MLGSERRAQLVLSRQQHVAKKSETKAKHNYHVSISQVSHATRERVQGKIKVEKIPELEDKGDNNLWHELPAVTLKKYLSWARSKEMCSQITQNDLKRIVQCCNYINYFPFTERRRLAKISIWILSYIAQHNWQLTTPAIEALLVELKKNDPYTLNYTVLALSYATCNGQIISADIKQLLEKGIIGLEKINKLRHLHTIIIALSALSKLKYKLSNEKLDWLRSSLIVVKEFNSVNLYGSATSLISNAKESHMSNWRRRYVELKHLKKLVENKEAIAENDLTWSARRWEDASNIDASDLAAKTKVSHIIYHAVENRQRKFEEPEVVSAILRESLSHKERKIKHNAIHTINYLIINKEETALPQSEKIVDLLNEAMAEGRVFALRAFSAYIMEFGIQSLSNIKLKKWKLTLKDAVLTKNKNQEVRRITEFLIAYMDSSSNFDKLAELMLEEELSVNISAIFLEAAQQKIELAQDLLIALSKLLHKKYPYEARYNACLALSYAAEHSSGFEKTVINSILTYGIQDVDTDICNGSLSALAYYMEKRTDADKRAASIISPQLLRLLQDSIRNEKTRTNAAHLLSNLIMAKKDFSKKTNLNDEFYQLFYLVSKTLIQEETNDSARLYIMAFLDQAIARNVIMNDSIISSIAKLLECKLKAEIQIKAAILFGKTIEHCAIASLSKIQIQTIIKLIKEGDEHITEDAGNVLLTYVKKSNEKLPSVITKSIIEFLKEDELILLACEILENIAKKGMGISNELVRQIFIEAIKILKHEFPEYRLAAAGLLNAIAANNELPEFVVENLADQLEDTDDEVVEAVVSTLKSACCLKRYMIAAAHCLKLAKIASDINAELSVRKEAISILLMQARHGQNQPFDVFKIVIDILSQPAHASDTTLSELILQLIKTQTTFFRFSIANKNLDILEFYAHLEQLLPNSLYFSHIVLILSDAQRFGYQISANNIEILASALLNYTEEQTYEAIYNLLTNTKNLSDRVKMILAMEQIGKDIRKVRNHETRKIELAKLKLLIERGGKLSLTNLDIINQLAKAGVAILVEDLLTIYYMIVVNNRQKLSEDALRFLKKTIGSQDINKAKIAALTIAELLIIGEYVSEEYVVLLEQMIYDKKILELNYFKALEIVVKRDFKLSENTIGELILLAQSSQYNEELQCVVVRIFNALSYKQINPETVVSILSSILNVGISKKISYEIGAAIFNIIKFNDIKLDQKLIWNMAEQIYHCDDASQSEFFYESLLKISGNNKFSQEVSQILDIKEVEKILLNKAATIEEKIKSFEILKRFPWLITDHIFDAILQMINATNARSKKIILEFLETVQRLTKKIPTYFMKPISKLIEHQSAINILEIELEKHQDFSDEVVNSLVQTMLNHPTEKLRSSALKLLKIVKKLDPKIKHLIDIEFDKPIIQHAEIRAKVINLTEAVKKGLPLSLNNSRFLLKVLRHHTNQDYCQFAIKAMYYARETISSSLSDDVLLIMFSMIHLHKFPIDKIYWLCTYLLETHSITQKLAIILIDCLRQNILQGKVNEKMLDLFQVLIKDHIELFDFTLVNALIDNLTVVDESRCQKNIIKVLFLYFNKVKMLEVHELVIVTNLTKKLFSGPIMSQWITERKQQADAKNLFAFRMLNYFKDSLLTLITNPEETENHDYSPKVKRAMCKLLGYVYRMNNSLFSDSNEIVDYLNCYLLEELNVDKKIVDYIELLQSNEQKINLMFTIANCKNLPGIDFFYQTKPKLCVRELLCNELLSNFLHYDEDKFNNEALDFYDCLENFESSKKYKEYDETRDNVISTLLIKQKAENLSLQEISDLLIMLKDFDTSSLTILSIKGSEIYRKWINKILERTTKNFNDNDSQVTSLLNKINILTWDVELISDFFELVERNADIKNLIELFDFIINYSISSDNISSLIDKLFEEASDSISVFKIQFILEKSLLIQAVGSIFKPSKFTQSMLCLDIDVTTLQNRLVYRLEKLRDIRWSFQKLEVFLSRIQLHINSEVHSSFQVMQFMQALDEAFFYKIPEDEFYNCYLESKADDFISKLHQLAINKHFRTEGEEKSLVTLLNELKKAEINKKNPYISSLFANDQLQLILDSSKHIYKEQNIFASGFVNGVCIEKWQALDIQNWARYISTIKDQDRLLSEILAVIKRACLLQYKYIPRDTQLLSVILLLNRVPDCGRFAEIATGEGKSLIIAMLAIIKALRGEKVDIVTSSWILAKGDALQYQSFYQLFNLKAASNEDERYSHGKKKCYADDIAIVYGDSGNFQFDILRDEYSRLGTRGNRGFEHLIVDEVDNLLIDEGAKIAMLANPMPGMDELNLVLISIWQGLLDIVNNIKEEGEYIFYQTQSEICKLQAIDKISFIKKMLRQYLEYQLEPKNPNAIKFPLHLTQYVQSEQVHWIESAISAYFDYKEQRQYEIKTDNYGLSTIVPVDFQNTGVLQKGTTWNNGLHQFLQMKHGLPVSSLTLTTNLLSNRALVEKYHHNICGLTGTLGSKHAQALLSDIYKIDFVSVPTYRTKQFMELPATIRSSEAEWQQEIILTSLREANNGRVVLIICETKEEASFLHDKIRRTHQKTRLYVEDEFGDAQVFQENIDIETIVVATKLASRGTDLRLSKAVILNGGAHVISTTLSHDLRVERQIFGRASRKGEPGSGQLILNCNPEFIPEIIIADEDIIKLKAFRDEQEANNLEYFKKFEYPALMAKDELFQEFCQLIKELDEIEVDANEKPFMRAAIEERWGLWLKEMEPKLGDLNLARNEFQLFKQNILKEYKDHTVIKNPIYYINLGNHWLTKISAIQGKFGLESMRQTMMTAVDTIAELQSFNPNLSYRYRMCHAAIAAFDKAIALDPFSSYLAHYYKSYALIKLAEEGYKEYAKAELVEAYRMIDEYLLPNHTARLFTITQHSDFKNQKSNTGLLQQLTSRIEVLKMLSGSIHAAIEAIERSQKLIDIEFDDGAKSTTFHKLNTEKAISTLKNSNKGTVAVSFHDLKVHSDMGKQYQSVETFLTAAKQAKISIIFDAKKLQCQGDNLKQTVIQLLPIHRKTKPIAKNTESKQENSKGKKATKVLQTSKRKIGTGENINAFMDSVSEKITSATGTISSAVNTTVSDPFNKAANRFIEHLYQYADAERIPVKLTFAKLDTSKTGSMIEYLNNKEVCDVILTGVDREFAKFILSQAQYASKATIKSKTNPTSHNQQHQATVDTYYLAQSSFPDVVDLQIHRLDKKAMKDLLALKKTNAKPILGKLSQDQNDITLIFSRVQQPRAEEILKIAEGEMALSFVHLSKEDVKKIIYLTEDQHDNAIIRIDSLDKTTAIDLIHNASRKEEDFNINLKPADAELRKLLNSKSEMLQYKINGYLHFYDLKELGPIPIRALCTVLAFGLLQIAGGIAILAGTGGAGLNFALSLFSEGICDLVRVGNGLYSRELNFSSYIWQKSLSLALSLGTAGWSSYQASNGVSSLAAVASEMKDEIAIAGINRMAAVVSVSDELAQNTVMMMSQTTKTIFIEPAKMSIAEVSKKFAINTGEMLANELVGRGIDQLTHNLKEHIEPMIAQQAEEKIRLMFADGYWSIVLKNVFVIEKCNENSTLRGRIIALAIHRIQILKKDLFDLQGFETFECDFTKVIRDIETEICNLSTFESILVHKLQCQPITNPKEAAAKICLLLEKQKILLGSDTINLDILLKSGCKAGQSTFGEQDLDFDKLDLGVYDNYKQFVVHVCREYYLAKMDDYTREKNKLAQEISSCFVAEVSSPLNVLADVGNYVTKKLASMGISAVAEKARQAGSEQPERRRRGQHRNRHRGRNREQGGIGNQEKASSKGISERNGAEHHRPYRQKSERLNTDGRQKPWGKRNPDYKNTEGSRPSYRNNGAGRGMHRERMKMLHQKRRIQLHEQQTVNTFNIILKENQKEASTPVQIAIYAIQKLLLQKYQQIKNSEYADKILRLKQIGYDLCDVSMNDYEVFLAEKRQMIQIVIQFILLEDKLSTQLQAHLLDVPVETTKIEEVEQQAIKVLSPCMIDPASGYELAVKALQIVITPQRKMDQLFTQLKEHFLDYNQLFGEIKMLQQTLLDKVKDLDVNNLAKSAMGLLENRQYDQLGLLFKNGDMNEGTFLVGSMFNGLLQAQRETAASETRVQFAAMELTKFVIQSKTDFVKELKEMNAATIKLLDDTRTDYSELWKGANEIFSKAVASGDAQTRKDALEYLNILKSNHELNMQVIKDKLMDSKAIVDFEKNHEKFLEQVGNIITTISEKKESTLKELISAGKDIINGVINRIGPQVGANGAPDVNQPANNAAAPSDWKTQFNAATSVYKNGKSALFADNPSKGRVEMLFKQATKQHTSIFAQIPEDAPEKAKTQKRLDNMKEPDGQYAPSKLPGLCGQ